MEVTGVFEVLANLKLFEEEALLHVKDAVMGAAQDAKEFADPLTPVSLDGSHGNPAGYLKSRNQVREGEVSMTEITAEYFNDAGYALYVDGGTVHMAAQPFMTPALVYGEKRLRDRLGGNI